jgi:general L-amino acid transport system permease protein
MATGTDIAGLSRQSEAPPVVQVGVLGWIRENLFGSPLNAILTVVGLYILYMLARSIVNFIPQSDWTVITSNWKLFLIGQYPREEQWRTLASLILVGVLTLGNLLFWNRSAVGRRVLVVLWLLSPIIIWVLLAGFAGFVLPIREFVRLPIRPPARWLSVGIIGLAFGIYRTSRLGQGFVFHPRAWALWFALPIAALILLNLILALVLPSTIFPVTYQIAFSPLLPNTLPSVRTQLWSGLLLTVMLAVVGIVASFPLGVLLALGRRSDLVIIKFLSIAYIEVVRGVPLISVLFMAQVMLPLFVNNRDLDVVLRAMGGFTIFSAAYVAETVRGGLQAIPRGQIEAAQAVGLNPFQINRLVVLPQAIRIVIPSLVGWFISLFKDTTLVSIITLLDLLGISEAAIAQKPAFVFHKKEVFLFLAAVYFFFSYLMSAAARRTEARASAMGGTRRI